MADKNVPVPPITIASGDSREFGPVSIDAHTNYFKLDLDGSDHIGAGVLFTVVVSVSQVSNPQPEDWHVVYTLRDDGAPALDDNHVPRTRIWFELRIGQNWPQLGGVQRRIRAIATATGGSFHTSGGSLIARA